MIRDEVVWYGTAVLLAVLAFYILPRYEHLTTQNEGTKEMRFVLTDAGSSPDGSSQTAASSEGNDDPNDFTNDYVRKSSLVPQTCIGCNGARASAVGGYGSITGAPSVNSTVPGDQDSAIAEGTKMEPDPFLTSFAAFGH